MPIYTDKASGIEVESREPLSDAEIEEAFMIAGAPAPGEQMEGAATSTPSTVQSSQTHTPSTVQDTAQTTPRSPNPQQPVDESTILPFLDRLVPAAVGAGSGAILSGGNPLAIMAGGAMGALGGDIVAQNQEMQEGTRAEYNPMRTAVETLTSGLASKMGVATETLFKAAGKAAGISALSSTITDISEGKPIPGPGIQAMNALTGAVIGGIAHKMSKRPELEELLGDEEAVMVADGILSGKRVRVRGADPDAIEDLRQAVLKISAPSRSTRRTRAKAEEILKSLTEVEPPEGPIKIRDPGVLPRVGMAEPLKFELERLQRLSGAPTFDDYLKVKPLHEKYKRQLGVDGKEIKSIFKGMGTGERAAMLRAVATGEAGSLPPDRVRRLGDLFDDALEKFELTRPEFFEAVQGNAKGLPKRLRGLAEYLDDGDVALGEPDALLAVSRLVRAARFREHVAPEWADMVKRYSGKDVPANVREPMMQYLNAVRGKPDKLTTYLTQGMNEALSVLDPTMDKLGKRKLRTDSRNVVSTIMSLNYSSLLGFRPGPVVRNTMQPIQLASPLMGGRWLARGYADIMTKTGRARAAAAGMQSQALELAEVEEIARSKFGRVVSGVTKAGMRAFSTVEDVNRGAVYLGTYEKAMWAAKKAKGNFAKFIDKADIDRYTPGEIDAIRANYMTGKIEDAADMAARFMVDNTQFMYGGPERPRLLQSMGGRVLGGFGIWPLSYGSYIRRNFTPLTSHGPAWKRGRDFARFTLVNGAIVGAMAGIGNELGDENATNDALSWTFFEPMFYTGGPVLELVTSAGKAGRELASGEVGHGVSEFRKNMAGFVPGSMAVKEAFKASEESTPAEAAGRLLGFKRGK